MTTAVLTHTISTAGKPHEVGAKHQTLTWVAAVPFPFPTTSQLYIFLT